MPAGQDKGERTPTRRRPLSHSAPPLLLQAQEHVLVYNLTCGPSCLLRSYQVGGSIPERCDGRLYNTCFVYGRDGRLLGRHRKVGARVCWGAAAHACWWCRAVLVC